jgi:hypothetical protein
LAGVNIIDLCRISRFVGGPSRCDGDYPDYLIAMRLPERSLAGDDRRCSSSDLAEMAFCLRGMIFKDIEPGRTTISICRPAGR